MPLFSNSFQKLNPRAGTHSHTGDIAPASASNENTLVFNLTTPYSFHLTGSSDAEGRVFDLVVVVTLDGPGVSFADSNTSGEHTFDQSWLLLPGMYTLNETAEGNGGGFGWNFDSNLQLAADFSPVVPEPSALPVLAGGVALMLVVARRIRQ